MKPARAPRAYYNEHDPFAAAWLRELIKAGHIAPGDVDERSIEDVCPDDLAGYVQCHFFAGIGVWSHALRLAGWPDHRAIWTGSCPCQPFSAAGKGAGFNDERHLWPAFFDLIQQCNPPVVVGEQVASKDGLAWLDLVSADVEGSGRAFAAADLCAAGFGAPHIRQRSFWVAYRNDDGHGQHRGCVDRTPRAREDGARKRKRLRSDIANDRAAGGMGHADGDEPGAERGYSGEVYGLPAAECEPEYGAALHGRRGTVGGMGQPFGPRAAPRIPESMERQGRDAEVDDNGRDRLLRCDEGRPAHGVGHNGAPSADSFWSDADWLGCRDGKWRPVIASPQPLVDGSSASLGRVCDTDREACEAEINAWAVEAKVDLSSAMRDLWCQYASEAKSCWTAGRFPRLCEAPFLLAYLRQLAVEGWSVAKGCALSCEETAAVGLRVLRDGRSTAGSPCRSGLAEQRAGQPSDPLHILSSLLARHAHQAWDIPYRAHAETRYPLTAGAANRVGRLRGYGNAIVGPVAQGFIQAVMAVRRDGSVMT